MPEQLTSLGAPTEQEMALVRAGAIADPVEAGQILQRYIASRAPVAWEGMVVGGLLHEIHRLRQTIASHQEAVEGSVGRVHDADATLWAGVVPPAQEGACCVEGGCGVCVP